MHKSVFVFTISVEHWLKSSLFTIKVECFVSFQTFFSFEAYETDAQPTKRVRLFLEWNELKAKKKLKN
jgi:hypothetical protein